MSDDEKEGLNSPHNILKYLAIGRLAPFDPVTNSYKDEKHQVLACAAAPDEKNAKVYKSHVKQIMLKGATKLKPGKRIRLTSDDNNYDVHVLPDALGEDQSRVLIFFVVTDPNFAKNNSLTNLLRDFKAGFYHQFENEDLATTKSGSGINRSTQALFTSLFNQYNSSKLLLAAQKVEVVKNVMSQNVKKALNNVEQLEEMESKSEEMENQARKFEKNSNNVKSLMRWRYIKITIILGVVVLAIVALIIYAIVSNTKK